MNARPSEIHQRPSPWLPWTTNVDGDQARVFCLHHAGGSAAVFRSWIRPAESYSLTVCPVELPGRGTRHKEAPPTDIAALVESMADGLAPYMDGRPCVLFGHSLGGLICAFLADILSSRETGVAHLYLSAIAANQSERTRGWADLDDAALCLQLAKSGLAPPEILANSEFMALAIMKVRADLALVERTIFESQLTMPLTVFSGTRDTIASCAAVAEWCHRSSSAFRHIQFEDDHSFLSKRFADIMAVIKTDLSTHSVAMPKEFLYPVDDQA